MSCIVTGMNEQTLKFHKFLEEIKEFNFLCCRVSYLGEIELKNINLKVKLKLIQ